MIHKVFHADEHLSSRVAVSLQNAIPVPSPVKGL